MATVLPQQSSEAVAVPNDDPLFGNRVVLGAAPALTDADPPLYDEDQPFGVAIPGASEVIRCGSSRERGR